MSFGVEHCGTPEVVKETQNRRTAQIAFCLVYMISLKAVSFTKTLHVIILFVILKVLQNCKYFHKL